MKKRILQLRKLQDGGEQKEETEYEENRIPSTQQRSTREAGQEQPLS